MKIPTSFIFPPTDGHPSFTWTRSDELFKRWITSVALLAFSDSCCNDCVNSAWNKSGMQEFSFLNRHILTIKKKKKKKKSSTFSQPILQRNSRCARTSYSYCWKACQTIPIMHRHFFFCIPTVGGKQTRAQAATSIVRNFRLWQTSIVCFRLKLRGSYRLWSSLTSCLSLTQLACTCPSNFETQFSPRNSLSPRLYCCQLNSSRLGLGAFECVN